MTPANASDEIPIKREKTISVEYLSPTGDDRDIKTYNLDLTTLMSKIDRLNLSIYAGIAATYATGNITQLKGDINQGTLRKVKLDNSAYGLGPGVLLSFRLIEMNRWSINLNGSGHFILYSERFPAGGDYYNFMWRGGPMIEYQVGREKTIGISYQRAHVSNGQGISQENPSYNASGFALRYTSLF